MSDLLSSDFLEQHRQALTWIFVIGCSLLITFCLKRVVNYVSKKWHSLSRTTRFSLDDILALELGETKSVVIFIWVFFALSQWASPDSATRHFLRTCVVIASSVQVGIWGSKALKFWERGYVERRVQADASAASAMQLIRTAVNAVFFIALCLICLSNLGVDIGALLAGLGIGGVAIALAAQNILGDLFASLSIVLDKPFMVGDYIVVGNDQGTVENIGIKTTRVRSLTGEELIFSNKDLLESRVKNFKRMWKRRVALKVSVSYETPLEQLKNIPGWFQQKIQSMKELTFERSHLSEYGNEALTFETIFWVNNSDYQKYMDLQQEILLAMIDKFRKEDISSALPIRVFKNELEVYSEEEDDGLFPPHEHHVEN